MKCMVVGGIAGYVGSMFLLATCGPVCGGVVLGLTFGAAYVGHTERSRWLVGLFLSAIDKHMSRKEAAIVMGVQASQMSRWDTGEEQMPVNKVAKLPNTVLIDAVTPLLEGLGLVVVPSGRLASATSAMLRLAAAVEAPAPATRPRQGVA